MCTQNLKLKTQHCVSAGCVQTHTLAHARAPRRRFAQSDRPLRRGCCHNVGRSGRPRRVDRGDRKGAIAEAVAQMPQRIFIGRLLREPEVDHAALIRAETLFPVHNLVLRMFVEAAASIVCCCCASSSIYTNKRSSGRLWLLSTLIMVGRAKLGGAIPAAPQRCGGLLHRSVYMQYTDLVEHEILA
jgi:hypothetical protein